MRCRHLLGVALLGAVASPLAAQAPGASLTLEASVLEDQGRSPRAQLDRTTVVAALISSRRVHRDVKTWIVQGERFDTVGLGVNGDGYIRFADLTGDGRRGDRAGERRRHRTGARLLHRHRPRWGDSGGPVRPVTSQRVVRTRFARPA